MAQNNFCFSLLLYPLVQWVDTFITLRVLQTEAGLVTFCNLGTIQTQKIIVCEDLHTVVVSVPINNKIPSSHSCISNSKLYFVIWDDLACDTRARSRRGIPAWVWSRIGLHYGSGMRSGAGVGTSCGRLVLQWWRGSVLRGRTGGRTWACPPDRWSAPRAER